MILVDIIVPSVNETFDFMLDENQYISVITEELRDVISKHLKTEAMGDIKEYRLYIKNSKRLLNTNSTLFESGVRDCSTLIFI